jgi:phytoene desaturase
MKTVAVVGAGFSGLSAACCLAKEGFDVTVLEKNGSAGGRARKLDAQGYTFDMGPSWYWMPDVFERFFHRFGKSPADYYDLIRLDPSYRVFYAKGEVLDLPATMPDMEALFESLESGSGLVLRKFLQEAKFKYDLGINKLVYKPGLGISEFLDFDLLKGLGKLHVFRSISSHIRQYFSNPKIIGLLEFPVLFLGAAPRKTPALYSLMNYADMSLGTWYPMGGMHKIVDGMTSLARSLGVKFEFNSEVQQVTVEGSRASGLVVNNQPRVFDYIMAGADYHHVEQNLLPRSHRHYDDEYWQNRTMAPSSIVFYLGVNKKLENLLHHNLFFDEDFDTHLDEIYGSPKWPTRPLFYVCCSSKTDTQVAPAGHENLFVLIPVAAGLADSEALREKYFGIAIDRLERLTGQSIRSNIVYKRSYAHNDFIHDYNAYKGNAYGLANTLLQTAFLKPSLINKRVDNLFYTGQLTVPGPGVPPAIISGQVAADLLISKVRKFKNAKDEALIR